MRGRNRSDERPAGVIGRAHGGRVVPPVLLLAVLANSAMVPLMPYLLATRLGWQLWHVGLYAFAVTATTIVINRRASKLVDRGVSAVMLCAIGGAAQIVAGVAAGAALDQPVLLVLVVPALALGGATVPVFYVMGRRAGVAAGRDMGKTNSLLRVATSGGWVLGPAASFALLGWFNPEVALLSISTAAAVGLLVLVLLRRRLDGPPADAAASARHEVTQPADRSTRTRMRFAAVLVFLLSFAHIATTTSLPLLLVEHVSIDESHTGLVIAVKAFVEMCAILLSPWVLARFSPRTALAGCSLLAVAAYGVYLAANGWVLGVLGSVLEGGYYGLFAAVGLTWMQSLSPSRVGWSTGTYMTGIYAGTLLASPLSGVVAHFWLPGITVLSMVAAITALVISLWKPRAASSPTASAGSDQHAPTPSRST